MVDPVVALLSLRWEVGNEAEFACAVMLALSGWDGVVAAELGHRQTTHAAFDSDTPRIEHRAGTTDVPLGRMRRPREGWGADEVGTEVRASARVALSLPTRYEPARLVVWTRARSKGLPRVDEVAHAVAAVLDARVLLGRVAKLSRAAHASTVRLRRSLRDATQPDVVAHSPAMRRCVQRVDAVAPFDTAVLVRGPSGSGKELLARRIHRRSARRRQPFVAINCGAIPETLAESELFGHVRGAFTGATHDRAGVFAQAHGGTLFLDEVGELSLPTQVKLLRVLQEGAVVPVGRSEPRSVDVRVVAATHRDLDAAVAEGNFREDLFYRLAVFDIAVPGLAERAEDLPFLVHSVLAQQAARLGVPVPAVSPKMLAALTQRAWPGNVRELQNVLEAALVMAEDGVLRLPMRPRRPPGRGASLEATIRRAIEAALVRSGGKVYGPGGAAEALGLHPATLQSKMRKLGIDRARFVGP